MKTYLRINLILAITLVLVLGSNSLFFIQESKAQSYLESSEPVSLPYKITDAFGVPDITPGATFFTSQFMVNYQDETIMLSGAADGTGDTSVNDGIEIIVTHPDGSTETFFHNYAPGCIPPVQTLSPHDISSLFAPGLNIVSVRLFDICGGGAGTTALYLGVPEIPEPVDISIKDVKPVQVVYDSDVDGDTVPDLVLEKPLAVKVTIDADGDLSGFLTETTTVTLDVLGNMPDTETISVTQLADGPVDLFLYATPRAEGLQQILVTLEPSFEGEDPSGNTESVLVNVKETRDLSVVYFKVEFEGELPPAFDITAGNANKFIRWVYPIAYLDPHVVPLYNSLMSACNHPLCRFYFLGDVAELWLRAKKLFPLSSDRVVALVPQRYVTRLFFDECGPLGTQISSVAFMTGGHPTGVAHEIGHSYGLGKPEEYGKPIPLGNCEFAHEPEGPPARGFNVEEKHPVEGEGIVGFMGAGPGLGPEQDIEMRWVANHNFVSLFGNKEFLVNLEDPEVLLVTGQITPDGIVKLAPLHRLPEGIPDVSQGGNYALRFLDGLGGVIQSVSFEPDFVLERDPLLPITTDTGVFMIAAPYPEPVLVMQIQKGEEILLEVDLTSTLLHDAIDAIPNFGFVRNPEQMRNALHNKISEVEEKIRAGDTEGAVNKLQNDIKVHLEMWLLDDYQTENVLQYSKAELLSLVDDMIKRLADPE